MNLIFSQEVREAQAEQRAVLALESTIIAHGMPYPENLEFAREAETLIRNTGVTPATIAILEGEIHVGLEGDQIATLAQGEDIMKVATRELGLCLSRGASGATTVSATMRIAHLAGISVFATGGIGGVHRGAEETMDISADILELSRTPVMVISAGVKAILDMEKTLEVLESYSVPVIGFQTDEMPAFYSRTSGLSIPQRMDDMSHIAHAFHHQLALGISAGMLVANPVPTDAEYPQEEVEKIIQQAVRDAENLGITGKDLTPYLLGRIVALSEGRSLTANRALALNNARLGAEIARELSELA